MHKKLLIPGPTEVSREVLEEQTRYLIGHREKEFSTLYGGITDKLTNFFQLTADIKPTITTGSGTLWFDIVARSVVKQKALACVNGAFSKRAAQTLQACGKETDVLDVEMGKAIKADAVAEKLENGKYDTVTVCHNETSTGVCSPIKEIAQMIRRDYPEVILAVDAVSSLAGDKLIPSEIGCDIIFASTQKCFALPPGLAVGLVSDRAIERAKTVPNRGAYTDMVEMFEFEKKHQTPFTPNVSLLYALDKRMDLLLAETYERVYQRHLNMAKYTQEWAKKHFEMFPEPGYESVTVSCINNTQYKNVKALNQQLADRGYLISAGYGALADKTFRVGHMGEWTVECIQHVINMIDEIWDLKSN
ncbi:MAG: alanine--glyoxylate aminotransferase family protein [Nitrososphaerota archaeon]|jgi:aspartate aminotransferase-like enzyme|nr:alanine--glyoxylate aminotransferase family protein [Nitrososphaerota archaeon]